MYMYVYVFFRFILRCFVFYCLKNLAQKIDEIGRFYNDDVLMRNTNVFFWFCGLFFLQQDFAKASEAPIPAPAPAATPNRQLLPQCKGYNPA